MELDITPMTPCECDPNKPNPCGPGSDCINRYLFLIHVYYYFYIIFNYFIECLCLNVNH